MEGRAHDGELAPAARRRRSMLAPTSSTAVDAARGSASWPRGPAAPGRPAMRRISREMAISAPVLPAETAACASPVLTPPRRSTSSALAAAHGLGRLVVHGDHAFRRGGLRTRSARPGFAPGPPASPLLAVQQEAEAPGAAGLQSLRHPGNDDRRAVVAAHGVDRDHQWVGHGGDFGSFKPPAARAGGRYSRALSMQPATSFDGVA